MLMNECVGGGVEALRLGGSIKQQQQQNVSLGETGCRQAGRQGHSGTTDRDWVGGSSKLQLRQT